MAAGSSSLGALSVREALAWAGAGAGADLEIENVTDTSVIHASLMDRFQGTQYCPEIITFSEGQLKRDPVLPFKSSLIHHNLLLVSQAELTGQVFISLSNQVCFDKKSLPNLRRGNFITFKGNGMLSKQDFQR